MHPQQHPEATTPIRLSIPSQLASAYHHARFSSLAPSEGERVGVRGQPDSEATFHYPSLPISALCIAALLFALPAPALNIRSYDATRHSRFASGFPGAPVANSDFYGNYYDFSGVGWRTSDPSLGSTLISPLHFVGANHVQTGIGETLNFRARDGVVRSFTVTRVYNITNTAGENTDLFVGELNRPVTACDNITYYPILSLPSEAAYAGRELWVYGKTGRVGKGSIGAFQDFGEDPVSGSAGVNSTRAYSFSYANAFGGPDDSYAEVGDSGSPSFVGTDAELFLVGTHTSVATTPLSTTTFDTFVPNYLNQISAILQSRGYQAATTSKAVFRLCYQLTTESANSTRLTWTGLPNRTYQVEASTNLTGNYTAPSGPITTNSATVTFLDTSATSQTKYYRVRRLD